MLTVEKLFFSTPGRRLTRSRQYIIVYYDQEEKKKVQMITCDGRDDITRMELTQRRLEGWIGMRVVMCEACLTKAFTALLTEKEIREERERERQSIRISKLRKVRHLQRGAGNRRHSTKKHEQKNSYQAGSKCVAFRGCKVRTH